MKKALITGVTGQDGSYLSELLISKNYQVHGIKRRSSSLNTQRVDHLFEKVQKRKKFFLHYGDLTDTSNLYNLVERIRPDEIYNLGAQSHVSVSFETPEYTANADALGALRILEAIKLLKLNKKTKFYQASTSEIFGNHKKFPLTLNTNFNPVSPYGTSKLFSYWITKNYRDAYGIFASNGILFNHESPRRGETFVTRKVINFVAKYKIGVKDILYIGNLDAKRDWGHAKEYVEGMWKILQKKESGDFILASGKSYSVRYLISSSFNLIGIRILWKGKGVNEKGYCSKTNNLLVSVDKRYFRPNEINNLVGETKTAKKQLNWEVKIKYIDLIKEMLDEEIQKLSKKN